MTTNDPGAPRTFDLVRSARKSQARVARKRFVPLAIGAAVVTAGVIVGGRVGSGITLCGLFLLARTVDRRALKHWLEGVAKGQLRSPNRDDDSVDVASWQSFPASDPPALSHR